MFSAAAEVEPVLRLLPVRGWSELAEALPGRDRHEAPVEGQEERVGRQAVVTAPDRGGKPQVDEHEVAEKSCEAARKYTQPGKKSSMIPELGQGEDRGQGTRRSG